MNSVEAYKGFITFLILGSIVGLSVLGFNLINKSSNTESSAKEDFSDPQNIQITFPTNNSVSIKWETFNETQTELEYSLSIDFQESKKITPNASKSKSHSVVIDQLLKGSTYYYKIIQKDKGYPLSGEPYSFLSPDISNLAPIIREINEDQMTEETTLPANSEMKTDSPLQQNTTSETEEYGGFENPTEYNPQNAVLGKQTYVIGENIAKEFKEASLYQDMRYDFNHDSKVDTNDYPLFINFILNQED